MSSELIEELRKQAVVCHDSNKIGIITKGRIAKAMNEAATTIAALQAELAEAREAALEDAAQEADKWFPANTASRYPTGGIAAAIRAMKP